MIMHGPMLIIVLYSPLSVSLIIIVNAGSSSRKKPRKDSTSATVPPAKRINISTGKYGHIILYV